MQKKNPLLEVKELKTEFQLSQRTVHAVNGVTFTINEGEVLGIVGESGCGKSVTALSIMRLIEEPGKIVSGEIWLHSMDNATDLVSISSRTMEQIRGNQISMIFQDPMTSLNPVLTIGQQLTEPYVLHRHMNNEQARKEAINLLDQVGIPAPEQRLKEYPHQFSGGMRQRVMVAMAVACIPKLLIADEPTTALDVTIQAQILELIVHMKEEINTSVIIITHDLGVVAEMADRIAVMYAGLIVENGDVEDIFAHPSHPYTSALLGSIPGLRNHPQRLTTIEGSPPSLTEKIEGCPFAPRCAYRIDRCDENPPLLEIRRDHLCACWVAQQGHFG